LTDLNLTNDGNAAWPVHDPRWHHTVNRFMDGVKQARVALNFAHHFNDRNKGQEFPEGSNEHIYSLPFSDSSGFESRNATGAEEYC